MVERFKRWLQFRIRLFLAWLKPKATPRELDLSRTIRTLSDALDDAVRRQDRGDVEQIERIAEMIEARQMAGIGPWTVSPATISATDELIRASMQSIRTGTRLRETAPAISQGAYGDIELALQNVEWRREINLSWLEFSRWGIQQLILISRLYYVKNPLIQRGVNISSYYVFGRGVEVSSEDDDANETLREFFERNRKVIGPKALAELDKRLGYDGQVFFCLFADRENTGQVSIRTIDATEIQEIVTNPEDTDEPWYYRRQWSQRTMNPATGTVSSEMREAWYPAVGYEPADRPQQIASKPVMWESPIYHMRGGIGVSKWHFDVPRVYAALDWAKAARKFLEACATVKQALAQFSMTFTTKGGQQALAAAKQQLQTTVNTSASLWDTNPTADAGSIFAAGSGTTLTPFNTRSAGADPEEVRQFKLMVCMVLDIPETFLGDVSTGNLATATTLDRPTELAFRAKQEVWTDCLMVLGKEVLRISAGAPNGKLRDGLRRRQIDPGSIQIMEAKRVYGVNGGWRYAEAQKESKDIQVRVVFPAIREGDMPLIVKAIVEAMTLNNRGGQIVGIDEKLAVLLLMQQLGVENPEEMLEKMYPDKKYDPDRTKEPLPPPIGRAQPDPGGQPQLTPSGRDPQPRDSQVEAARKLLAEVRRARSKSVAAD